MSTILKAIGIVFLCIGFACFDKALDSLPFPITSLINGVFVTWSIVCVLWLVFAIALFVGSIAFQSKT